MYKNFLFFFLITTVFISLKAQTVSIAFGNGISVFEEKNNKQNALNKIVGVETEFDSPFLFWTFNTGIQKFETSYGTYNLAGNNLYKSHNFLVVPFGLRKHMHLSKRSELLMDFDLLFSYHYKQKEEIFINNSKTINNRKNIGVGIGNAFFLGFKTQIGGLYYFIISSGGNNLNAIWKNYHNVNDEITTTDYLLKFTFLIKIIPKSISKK